MICILWVWSLDSRLIIFLCFIFLLLEDKQWFKFGEVDMYIICISFLIINLGFWAKFRIYSLMIWDFQWNIQLIGIWFILEHIWVQGIQSKGELDPTWGINLDPIEEPILGKLNENWSTQIEAGLHKSNQPNHKRSNQPKPSYMWSS